MNKKKMFVVAVIAAMLLAVGFRLVSTKFAEKGQGEAIKASMTANVELGEPVEVDTSNVIEAPGRVAAIKSSDVIARAQGFILKQHYKEGDYVREGQLLYTVDPNAYTIALDKAQANLESAKANQYQAQKDFERARELVQKDFISKSHYDQALAAKDAANANVHAAQAAVNDARRYLSYTRVTAPISGKIGQTVITVGNYLSSPTTVLAKIVSTDPIYVTYSLDSRLYSQLRNDEIIPDGKNRTPIKVEIKLPDGTIYEKTGQADFADNTISETTGSITLRATFSNPKGTLIPGDFVNVKVYSNKTMKALAVPQAAVMQDSEGKYLFTVDENNIAHRRKIETSGQKGDNWLIASGITKGEKFVKTGAIKVRDGAPVKVISNDAPKEVNAEDKGALEESVAKDAPQKGTTDNSKDAESNKDVIEIKTEAE